MIGIMDHEVAAHLHLSALQASVGGRFPAWLASVLTSCHPEVSSARPWLEDFGRRVEHALLADTDRRAEQFRALNRRLASRAQSGPCKGTATFLQRWIAELQAQIAAGAALGEAPTSAARVVAALHDYTATIPLAEWLAEGPTRH